MSHFTTIQTQIKDVEALKDACAELDLNVMENTEARGFGANRYQGEYVIQLRGPYDIAVVRQNNGQFGLVTDLWDGHVEREVGEKFGRLLQLYGVHKATREAKKRGLIVQRKLLHNGSIKLSLMGV